MRTDEKIAVIGFGYVGLPVAVARAETYDNVIGFDVSARRVAELKADSDWTHEVDSARLAFKEDAPDLRNSKVPDINAALKAKGAAALIHDRLADASKASYDYDLELSSPDDRENVDALIFAASHNDLKKEAIRLVTTLSPSVVIDVRSALDPYSMPADVSY